MATSKKTTRKASTASKRSPLFARLLESHFPKNTSSNKENDVIETKKFPNDNADLSHVPHNVQIVDMRPTNKNCDTIWVTLKYPSDKDEFVTLKYPSDTDEDYATLKDFQISSAITTKSKDNDIVTLKYPSDNDELAMS